jgi:hypothetical protein
VKKLTSEAHKEETYQLKANNSAWDQKENMDGYQSLKIRNTDQSFLHHIQRGFRQQKENRNEKRQRQKH